MMIRHCHCRCERETTTTTTTVPPLHQQCQGMIEVGVRAQLIPRVIFPRLESALEPYKMQRFPIIVNLITIHNRHVLDHGIPIVEVEWYHDSDGEQGYGGGGCGCWRWCVGGGEHQ